MKMCLVEIRDGKPFRIFKTSGAALAAPETSLVVSDSLSHAVYMIRTLVYDKAKGECQRCGKRLTWEHAHMDERVSRGNGGEISLDNSWILCYDCHLGSKNSEHGERRWGGRK